MSPDGVSGASIDGALRRVAFLLLLIGRIAGADPATAAAEVVALHRKGGDLGPLAARDDPDPWLVADALCEMGEFEVAEAYARAAPRRDVEALPRHVAARRAGGAGLSLEAGDAAAKARELGWFAREARELHLAGGAALDAGNLPLARDLWRARLEREVERGSLDGITRAQANLGIVLRDLGEVAEAFRLEEAALAGARKLGNRHLEAIVRGNLGNLHHVVRDYERALEYHAAALAYARESGDGGLEAMCSGTMGLTCRDLGRYDEALSHFARAKALLLEMGDDDGALATSSNIALTLLTAGRHEEALVILRDVQAAQERANDRRGLLYTFGYVASAHLQRDEFDAALAARQRAVALARELEDRDSLAVQLAGLAAVQIQRDALPEAAKAAEESLRLGGLSVRGLAPEQGARARERFEHPALVGFLAARWGGDADLAFWFAEWARAGSLVESLAAGEATREAVVPAAVLQDEREARRAESVALRDYQAAVAAGERDVMREARAALDAARRRLVEAAERSQREAKAAAPVFYPEPATSESVRAVLAEHEVLVLYLLTRPRATALVLTRQGAEVCLLEAAADLEDAATALHAAAAGGAAAVERARRLLIDPLPIPEGTTRILISPEGVLATVPFAALLDWPVAYVPSGTALLALRRLPPPPGRGVLAIGDPEGNLPSSREEADAVGDEVLLGPQATRAALAGALAGNKRWRALHLACHGRVDAARPSLSALALADGPLTVLDLFGLRVPADLAVLAACESGIGHNYSADGIFGFVHAFAASGAPRVLVSLWRVDDEATAVLMGGFYRLWRTGGTDAAAALRAAQEAVRAEPRWAHPRYWAAWQLWGVPD